MGHSRVVWALGVVGRWCLGMGLLVSFTASAGHDASPIGASVATLTARTAATPGVLIRSPTDLPLAQRLRPHALASVSLASLAVGEPQELRARPDEIDPRIVLKRVVSEFPAPDRTRRGDPSVGLRPTFDAKMRQRGGVAFARFDDLLFSAQDYLAFNGLAPPPGETTDGGWSGGATAPAFSAHSPSGAGAGPSLVVGAFVARSADDGATPAAPRASALASTTPAQAEHRPVQIVAAPQPSVADPRPAALAAAPNSTSIAASLRPSYVSLIDKGNSAAEVRCLTEVIYFEARSEPEAGQAAVAQVVLNRARSGLYPDSICGVVYQNRHRHLACQFTFTCEGKALRVTEPDKWLQASRIAGEVLTGKTYLSDVGGSTHYHANYVNPRWARSMKKTDTIGNHIFYKLRSGPT